jgi:uncharacterized protein YukE
VSDATRLGILLEDYAEALAAHLGTVREEFTHLERAWAALSDVYEGTAAEQFRDVFLGTAARMHAYEEDGAVLLALLRRRIEAPRHFDTPEAGL